MALRVAEEDVKAIVDTDRNVLPFITVANLVINSVLGDSSLPTDLLFEIERWLSAHFLCIMDERPISESEGGASATFVGISGKGGAHPLQGLSITKYGQQVLLLDTTGKLAAFGRRKAKIGVISEED